MHPLVEEFPATLSPESLVERLRGEPGIVLLRSALFDSAQARYSFVTAQPFLRFRSFGSRCELYSRESSEVCFGDPWRVLESLMPRYELLEELDLPFPLGGCFGYWGYDLKNFVEPKLPRRAVNDLELPDCQVGFYASLVVFDHRLGKAWVVSTGLQVDGSRTEAIAQDQLRFWKARLAEGFQADERGVEAETSLSSFGGEGRGEEAHTELTPNVQIVHDPAPCLKLKSSAVSVTASSPQPSPPKEEKGCQQPPCSTVPTGGIQSNLTRTEFLHRVARAQTYIRAGDIYQVNLSQRLSAAWSGSGWDLFQQLSGVSPAPFSAYLDFDDFQIASSSPELFLRLSGPHIQTRPIKGTRPRSADATRDAQLTYELQTSPKEMAELLMITDLLRNDLGRVCEFGSVQVPELVRLERYPQVQHLVSTVEGRLRSDVTHFSAFAACFPGGSITGAPKYRAMEIIDELEPVSRGPYTGALGYLGFNRETQLSILIRSAVCKQGQAYFHTGAGIVADSIPEAEYQETLDKARGFVGALQSLSHPGSHVVNPNLTSQFE